MPDRNEAKRTRANAALKPTATELRKQAKTKGIKGFSKMTKDDLTRALASSSSASSTNRTLTNKNMEPWVETTLNYLLSGLITKISPSAISHVSKRVADGMHLMLHGAATVEDVRRNAIQLALGSLLPAQRNRTQVRQEMEPELDRSGSYLRKTLKTALKESQKANEKTGSSRSRITASDLQTVRSTYPEASPAMITFAVTFMYKKLFDLGEAIIKEYSLANANKGMLLEKRMVLGAVRGRTDLFAIFG